MKGFREERCYLSNFHPSKIKLGDVTYDCAEAAFQAVKLEKPADRKQFAGLTGAQARSLGRKVQLRPDWEQIKLQVMEWVVREKFKQNNELMYLLKHEDGDLVEENSWNDKFWGVVNGEGRNELGKILMKIRDEK